MADEPQEVIEGTIVPYELSEQARRFRETQEIYDEDARRQIIHMRVAGMSLRAIRAACEEQYGHAPSIQTIKRWVTGKVQEGVNAQDPVNMAKLRAEAAMTLEAVAQMAWDIALEFPKTTLALDALDRVGRATTSRIELLGLKRPVRHDVTVTQISEADRELMEMVGEAKAREALREAEVIRAATEDSEL